MNYRFYVQPKKSILWFLLAVMCVGFSSCHDDYDLDDPGNYPSWLGSSIYDALENPNQEVLTGTFNTYLRLVKDMGYDEILSRTGSKTVFPANDEAFNRFFADNDWGVSSYEQLTEAMKKQLLYSSMLDNALLVEMLSNVPATNSSYSNVNSGIAMKHTTGANVIDTITHIYGAAGLPQNNSYWTKFYNKGIDMVMDATRPMMIHFTEEHMTANSITTQGAESDFAIITGSEYSDGMAYIFRDKIINSDVTCQNGYIQQVEDVLVPPGNVAEVLRNADNTTIFSRMMERFSAPYYNSTTTNNYNDYAQAQGLALIDSIYEKRYFSSRSQGGRSLNTDPNGAVFNYLLTFDPGWNTYTSGATGTNDLSDISAMFVPTDDAFKTYFLSGQGADIIKRYGHLDNTEANLNSNIDDIDINIVKDLLNNFMKSSFANSVPSKFGSIMKSGSGDPMGIEISDLHKQSDGKYDVKIGNNGVIYMLDKVFPPDKFSAVSAPALFATNMNIMRDAINDGDATETTNLNLNLNYYAYLLAMSSNYGFFIPTDEAFSTFYVDPVTLGAGSNARALKFYYDRDVQSTSNPYVRCSEWKYNPNTGEVGDSVGELTGTDFPSTQLKDILNLHTVVLADGETIGNNTYYKTKNGAAVKVDLTNMKAMSGAQIDNGRPVSNIIQIYNQDNGTTFSLDHPIEAPQKSVYKVMNEYSQFSEFLKLCLGTIDKYEDLTKATLLTYAGISSKLNLGTSEQDLYKVFTDNSGRCLDYNINYFSSYNYTVYMPDNEAMQKAYRAGLPTWDDVADEYTKNEQSSPARVKAMVKVINDFIRYHFQSNSVFADNTVESGSYASFSLNSMNVPYRISVSGGNGVLQVTDNTGTTINISDDGHSVVNKMARDMVYNQHRLTAKSLITSSFSIIHEIHTPLNHISSLPAGAARTSDGIYRYDYDIPE